VCSAGSFFFWRLWKLRLSFPEQKQEDKDNYQDDNLLLIHVCGFLDKVNPAVSSSATFDFIAM
jgi:hypothetical protein